MSEAREHRGVPYYLPLNDDGIWRYKIHPGHLKANTPRPRPAAADGYGTRAEAIAAAELAIEDWIRGEP
jgi:hypothetical protein